jgi:pimeloyl-ACP methyl ester carboxylesterase
MSPPIYKSETGAQAVRALYRQVLDGWPIPKTELRVPTREGETFVVACGSETAPPLILLHGGQSNAAAWMFDAVVWSHAFRCYAVDMIGEAGFSAPVRPPLDSDAHARWLDDVVRGLGLQKASFVGVSLGGWLALDYTNRRPEAVERLALLCPAGIGRQKNFLLKSIPLLLLGAWGRRKVREMVFGRAQGEPPPALRPFIELMRLIGRSIRPRIVWIPRLTDAELARLKAPMLVIVGGRDVLIDSEDTRQRLAKWTPQAEVVYLPEARHLIPGQTARILDFLQAGSG